MTYNQVPPRSEIKIGGTVKIIQKQHYETGEFTVGKVAQILTSKPIHPRGVKVRLTSGIVGRVQALGDGEIVPVETVTAQPATGVDYQIDPDDLA